MEARRLPPSAARRRALALVSVLFPSTLPLAIVLARRVRRETEANPHYRWRKRLIDRPILFVVAVWIGSLLVVFVGYWVNAVVFEAPAV